MISTTETFPEQPSHFPYSSRLFMAPRGHDGQQWLVRFQLKCAKVVQTGHGEVYLGLASKCGNSHPDVTLFAAPDEPSLHQPR